MKVVNVLLSSLLLLSYRCKADRAAETDVYLRGKQHTVQNQDHRSLQALTGTILRLELINAVSDTKILDLFFGQVVDLSAIIPRMSAPTFNINAVVSGGNTSDIKSVKFGFNATLNFRVESTAPYALCGDMNSNYATCAELGFGTHNITATPFGSPGATGVAGVPLTLTFTIVSNSKAPTSISITNAPVAPSSTTKAPVRAPTMAPVRSPTMAPVRPPTIAPIRAPTMAPVRAPTMAPIRAPAMAPVSAPTMASVLPTTRAPIPTPPFTAQPTAPNTCTFPKFVGSWQSRNPKYPIPVAEAQGAMIGNDLVLVSGFFNGFKQATAQTYAMDTTNSSIVWRRMEDMPVPQGITHGSFVVIGMKFYMCGGYIGGHPGLHIANCLIYDHSKAPGTGQWSSFASLPGGGRAGGGMVYDTARNALYFSGGGQRPVAGNPNADDYPDTWMYSFNNSDAGWVSKSPIPFLANHMSFVTAKDATGKERHYFLGGQTSENECCGNHADNFEWDAVSEVWIKRAPMPLTRGHAASSTRAIGCGFIISGGTSNGIGKTSDVSYYNIPTDSWVSIGNLTNAINTPVCDLKGGYLYCESGWATGKFSFRHQITL